MHPSIRDRLELTRQRREEELGDARNSLSDSLDMMIELTERLSKVSPESALWLSKLYDGTRSLIDATPAELTEQTIDRWQEISAFVASLNRLAALTAHALVDEKN